ncbi:MAG TPA: hypothetical protein VIK91_06945, partial [Nannocystis sp.]
LATAQVAREDPLAFAVAHRGRQPVERGVKLALPSGFDAVEADQIRHPSLPVLAGWLDTQALRGGHLVQLVVVEGAPPDGGSALFSRAPALAHELVIRTDAESPPAFDGLASYTLLRNGEPVARMIERPLGDRTLLLIAAPLEALDQGAELYAAIVRDAARVE